MWSQTQEWLVGLTRMLELVLISILLYHRTLSESSLYHHYYLTCVGLLVIPEM